MAVHRTRSGYQIWYYDADGRFRKRTLKGITRDDALRLERELLARRDRGDEIPDRRRTPTFSAFAEQWKGEGRARWKPATIAQYQNVLKKQLLPAFGERRRGFCGNLLMHVPGGLAFGVLLLWSDLFLYVRNGMTFEALLL